MRRSKGPRYSYSAILVTTQPARLQRRARQAGRVVLAAGLLALHVIAAVVVLAVRIPYAVLGPLAREAARAELALSQVTGRSPVGQTVGVALAEAFTTEFRTAYHGAPPR